MLLFFLAYRRFATVHYAFLPLATGLALTFIFAAATLGELNSATSGFSALLVGLGIDFTIVTYGRYLEGRLAGASHRRRARADGGPDRTGGRAGNASPRWARSTRSSRPASPACASSAC